MEFLGLRLGTEFKTESGLQFRVDKINKTRISYYRIDGTTTRIANVNRITVAQMSKKEVEKNLNSGWWIITKK